MFDHSYSGNCVFGNKCRKVLCPFQHKRTDEEDVENAENDEHLHTNELEPIQNVDNNPTVWAGVQDLDCSFCGDPSDHAGEKMMDCSKCDFAIYCIGHIRGC